VIKVQFPQKNKLGKPRKQGKQVKQDVAYTHLKINPRSTDIAFASRKEKAAFHKHELQIIDKGNLVKKHALETKQESDRHALEMKQEGERHVLEMKQESERHDREHRQQLEMAELSKKFL
jgi:hypothetical protein